MAEDDKLARIVEARLKLRERFQRDMQATPSLADDAPMGSGPTNRHGMPQLPPDQYETKKWPVLDLGIKPEVPRATWKLTVDGAVAAPRTLAWADLEAFDQVEDVSDFHCVTKWSRMNMRWRGVRLADVLAAAEPRPTARFVMCHAYDGYTTNLPLAEALKPDVLLVHTFDGAPLEVEHGGPCRVITPQLYAWKGAKWVSRLEVLEDDRPGFWEERGYSNTAYPWRNDRYS
ncbi:MAG: sulfite oxidase-like oxidoreductase [Myxococcales bacterium]|nr:sulfite oxidase-like oxidoreductase [Myxococcales bacterium]